MFLLPLLPYFLHLQLSKGLSLLLGHSPRFSFLEGVCTKFLVSTLAAKGESPLEMIQRSTDKAKEEKDVLMLGGASTRVVGENQYQTPSR